MTGAGGEEILEEDHGWVGTFDRRIQDPRISLHDFNVKESRKDGKITKARKECQPKSKKL